MVEVTPERREGAFAHPRQARLVLVAGALAAVGLVFALVDPRGVRQLRQLNRDLERQASANSALKAQNLELRRSLELLGPNASQRVLEKAVREQLGFVRQDEVVFKFE